MKGGSSSCVGQCIDKVGAVDLTFGWNVEWLAEAGRVLVRVARLGGVFAPVDRATEARVVSHAGVGAAGQEDLEPVRWDRDFERLADSLHLGKGQTTALGLILVLEGLLETNEVLKELLAEFLLDKGDSLDPVRFGLDF